MKEISDGVVSTQIVPTPVSVLSVLALSRAGSHSWSGTTQNPCGSEPAREGGLTGAK
ncbi:hypothetical protein EMIT0P253_30354 [Pseudomonas sp. IT-P253]